MMILALPILPSSYLPLADRSFPVRPQVTSAPPVTAHSSKGEAARWTFIGSVASGRFNLGYLKKSGTNIPIDEPIRVGEQQTLRVKLELPADSVATTKNILYAVVVRQEGSTVVGSPRIGKLGELPEELVLSPSLAMGTWRGLHTVHFVLSDDTAPTTPPAGAPSFSFRGVRRGEALKFESGTGFFYQFNRQGARREVLARDALGNPLTVGGRALYRIVPDTESYSAFNGAGLYTGITYLFPEDYSLRLWPASWNFGRFGVFAGATFAGDNPGGVFGFLQNLNREETVGILIGFSTVREQRLEGQRIGEFYVDPLEKRMRWSAPKPVIGIRYKF